ncbi:MAG: VOC family protein [Candidatus Omnitrophica bacterium]|nr:VOC family protein [Candidatus Omnitrophota bacterium]
MKKTKFLNCAPVLLVKNLEKSVAYYINQCGFEEPLFYGDQKIFCMLHRDLCELMLHQVEDPEQIKPHWKLVNGLWNIYYWVDDAKLLYDELRSRGVKIDYDLSVKEYGCLEFGIQDIDGYDIGFGQNIEPA